jgi:putative transposase
MGWSGSKKSFSCPDARELRKLVDHDHPELSISKQSALLGLPRSTLYYHLQRCLNRRCGSWPGSTPLYLEDRFCGSRRMVE